MATYRTGRGSSPFNDTAVVRYHSKKLFMATSRNVAMNDLSHADSVFRIRNGVTVRSRSGDADLSGQTHEIIRNDIDVSFRRPVDFRFRPELERPRYVGRFESGLFSGFQIEFVGRNHHDLGRWKYEIGRGGPIDVEGGLV